MQFKLIIIFVSLINISCVPTIKNFAKYDKQPILKSELINKAELKKNISSVVVFPFNNKNQKNQSSLGQALAVNIENILVANKLANLQDRNAFNKLEKEILLAEITDNSTNYKGPIKADFVISGEISEASFTHKFIAAQYVYNSNSSLPYRIPPKHKYTANFSGNIKIYQLPELTVKEIIPLKANSTIYEDAIEQRSWLINTKVDTSNLKKENQSLLKEAAFKSLKKNQHILKNIFSNYRKSYILEKRYNGKKYIFKISTGKNFNLKHGQKVKIFQKLKTINPLTNKETLETHQLGVGIISNIINENSAWIIVKDKNVAGKLKLGDFVTVIYPRSFASYI